MNEMNGNENGQKNPNISSYFLLYLVNLIYNSFTGRSCRDLTLGSKTSFLVRR